MFQKQLMMRRVLYSLAPVWGFSVWLYGPRVVAATAVSLGLGVLTEYLYERRRGGKVSEAVLVTCALYALSMPPAAPLWIVGTGIVFAVFTAKMIYGGFGRNVFNPALAGRLFVYISFAATLGRSFVPSGAFGARAGNFLGAPDALSSATPLAAIRSGGSVPLTDLITGLRDGAIGESPVVLIALAAVYLVATKTASWRIIVSELAAGGALPPASLLAGSFLFVAVFMGTDPVTAPKKPASQWAYGALIGFAAIVIRTFSAFPEGTSFAVLIGNTFASLMDEIAAGRKRPRTAKPAGAPSGDREGSAGNGGKEVQQ